MMPGISCLLLLLLVGGDSQRKEGLQAFKEGRYSVAAEKLQAALASDPKDQTARAFLAMTQAAIGKCLAALPVLTSVQGDLFRLAGLAAVKCYSTVGENTRAFELLDRLQKRFPNDADVLYLEAKLHMKAFNDTTYQMFQHTPSSYRVHELSAEIFEVQHQYEDAAAEYRKAIEENPAAPDLHYRLGRAMLLEKHDAESLGRAADEFRAELRISPEDSASEFQLGQIAQVEGKQDEARMHFGRALQLNPDYVQALIAIGKVESAQKNFGQAIPHLQRAVELQPSNETAHYALLTAYRDSGDLEKAKLEKEKLDRLQKPPAGEFSDFLKKLGEKQPQQ